jgi:Fe-S cluster assembly iron-binding protein IscA
MNVAITEAAASELLRLSAMIPEGVAGKMFIGICEGGCATWSFSISAYGNYATPVSRANGVTLFTSSDYIEKVGNISINYIENLTGCSFVFSGKNIKVMPCGNCFEFQ